MHETRKLCHSCPQATAAEEILGGLLRGRRDPVALPRRASRTRTPASTRRSPPPGCAPHRWPPTCPRFAAGPLPADVAAACDAVGEALRGPMPAYNR
ncbi:hypothetical protein GUY59_29910 [Nonomuraea sp. K271]|nr:hypothetical protein [Nonomuraea sp. K271]